MVYYFLSPDESSGACGLLAQLVEHIVHIDGVTGSSPVQTTQSSICKGRGFFISLQKRKVSSMTKFVPRPKLSKKARKELDAQKRTTWAFSPVTKKVESKKIYNRKKAAFAALGMVPRRTPPVAAFESCNGLAGFFCLKGNNAKLFWKSFWRCGSEE